MADPRRQEALIQATDTFDGCFRDRLYCPTPDGDIREALGLSDMPEPRPVCIDSEVVAELRHILAVFHNLPYGNPVPQNLTRALNAADDFLARFERIPF